MFKENFTLNVKATNGEETLELIYRILDTDISDRWIDLVDENNKQNNSLRYNYVKILSQEEIEENFQSFKANINYINENYDRVLTDIQDVKFLKNNQYILNDLHEEYEIYGDRLLELIEEGYFDDPKNHAKYSEKWPGVVQNKLLHESFLLLNEQIHNFESIYRHWNNPQGISCNCLTDFIPAGLHADLKPEDFLLFDPNYEWGWAYLGYNTLGKHWASCISDNDIEVIKRKAVRPQQRFAAELYMNFSIKDNLYRTRIRLYNMWTKNNFSEIMNPELRLRDLALGFIPIGKIYGYKINDGPLVYISKQTDKVNWNLNVWSKFNKIVEFKIVPLRGIVPE
jgi:hypothetical protein